MGEGLTQAEFVVLKLADEQADGRVYPFGPAARVSLELHDRGLLKAERPREYRITDAGRAALSDPPPPDREVE